MIKRIQWLPPVLAGVLLLAVPGAFAQLAQGGMDWTVLDTYCGDCHNQDDQAGGIAFDLLARDSLAVDADTWEMAYGGVIRHVRALRSPMGYCTVFNSGSSWEVKMNCVALGSNAVHASLNCLMLLSAS